MGVRQVVGDTYAGVPVMYIDNQEFETTNNIYSLYLAKDELAKDDTLLLESDLIYDPDILHQLVKHQAPNVAVVDRHQSWMDGTVVTISDDNTIEEFISKKEHRSLRIQPLLQNSQPPKISKKYLLDSYRPFLEAYVQAVGRNEY